LIISVFGLYFKFSHPIAKTKFFNHLSSIEIELDIVKKPEPYKKPLSSNQYSKSTRKITQNVLKSQGPVFLDMGEILCTSFLLGYSFRPFL
jgi:hypothetical protein